MDRTATSKMMRNVTNSPAKGRFKPYPEYKDSGIEWLGKIPAHWEVKPIKRSANVFSGAMPPESFDKFQGDCPVYGSNGVIGYCATSNIFEQRIIIGRVGASGEINEAPAGSWVTDNALIVETKDISVDQNFLKYSLRSMKLGEFASKNAQPIITASFIGAQVFAIPSLTEQQLITTFLDRETAKIDALISKKERLIELLQEKRTALISQAVTKGLDPNVPMKDSGIDWLGKIPIKWKIKRLKFIAQVIMGQSPPSEACNEVGDGTPFLQGNAEFGKEHPVPRLYCLNAAKKARAGSHLISVRAPVGAVNTADQEYGIGRGLCAVWPLEHEFQSRFCRYILEVMKCQLDEVSTGSTYEAVSANEVGNLICILPSLDEQRRISSFLDRETVKIDTLIGKIREAIDHLKEYRTALISAAVAGKIDVRNTGISM